MQTALADGAVAAGPTLSAGDRRPARSTRPSGSTSLNPSHKRAVVGTVAPATREHVAAGRRRGEAALPGWAALAGRASGPSFCAGPPPTMRAAAVRAGRLGGLRVRQAVARGRRPTCARRSTSASTTPPSAIAPASAARRRCARRGEPLRSTCRAAWRRSSPPGTFRWRSSPA